jgi:hypothetical protein
MRNSMKSHPWIACAAHLLEKSNAKSLQEQHLLVVFNFLTQFDALLTETATWMQRA